MTLFSLPPTSLFRYTTTTGPPHTLAAGRAGSPLYTDGHQFAKRGRAVRRARAHGRAPVRTLRWVVSRPGATWFRDKFVISNVPEGRGKMCFHSGKTVARGTDAVAPARRRKACDDNATGEATDEGVAPRFAAAAAASIILYYYRGTAVRCF